MEQENDAQLVAKYLKGDENSLRILYEKHIPSVYNFISRIAPNNAEIDDIIQVSFIKAWKNLKKFKSDYSFKTWLFTISKNTLLDHLKKKSPIAFSFNDQDENSESLEIKDSRPLQDFVLDQADSEERVSQLLGTLSPAQRAVVILRVMENLSFREIGTVLGQPMETVKTRYRRAISFLSNHLSENKLVILAKK